MVEEKRRRVFVEYNVYMSKNYEQKGVLRYAQERNELSLLYSLHTSAPTVELSDLRGKDKVKLNFLFPGVYFVIP